MRTSSLVSWARRIGRVNFVQLEGFYWWKYKMLDDVPCLSGTLFPNWVRCLMHPPTLTLITILISVQLLLTFYYFTQTLICDTLTSFTSKKQFYYFSKKCKLLYFDKFCSSWRLAMSWYFWKQSERWYLNITGNNHETVLNLDQNYVKSDIFNFRLVITWLSQKVQMLEEQAQPDNADSSFINWKNYLVIEV